MADETHDSDVTSEEPRAPEPFLDGMSRRLAALRVEYDWPDADVSTMFLAFLIERGRFGRFEYGPISIEVRVVEERFARTRVRTRPDAQWTGYAPSGARFLERVAAEVKRSGRRRVDELHWLLAFMRSPDGLPAEVFSELGITPEQVETFAQSGVLPSVQDRPVKLYSPEEVAEYLSVHVQTVRAWIRSGKLPAVRLAGRRDLRVRESDLGAVLQPVDPADFQPRGAEEEDG